MTTRNYVPRADNEGTLGTTIKKWAGVWATIINGLALAAQEAAFTITGGGKTLTVDETVTLSEKANITAAISDEDTTHSPDGNSIFNALAEKMPVVAAATDATLSGTPKIFTVYDGETPYYVKAYPTKT